MRRGILLRLADSELFLLVLFLIVLGAALIRCDPAPALARAPVLPDEQWRPTTRVWLARAMVGEAGWKSERDHVAIAYVFKRRWRSMSRRWPGLRFEAVVLRYAKALGGGRREFTPRQRWVRGLIPEAVEPDGWPGRASWRRHRPLWLAALRRADRWRQGRLPDPCGGRADHFGGTIDTPWEGLEEVDCKGTANTFYRLRAE